MRPATVLFLILWAVLVAPAAAIAQARQTLSPKQDEIMRLVGQQDGYISAELHGAFWGEFPPEIRDDPKARMRLAVDMHYLPRVYAEFERELWESARLSLAKGELLSTPGYAPAKEKLLQFIAIATFDAPAFVAAVNEADNILRAAALGTAYATGHGSMTIDTAFIDAVVAGMDASQSRLGRLLDPEYPNLPREWKYPEGHFRVFWPDPLVESRVEIPEGGYGREVVVYANRYDRDVFVSVQFLSLFKAESEPVRALLYGKLLASQMGFPGADGQPGEWEGRTSALVSGQAMLDGVEAELSLRLVLAPEHEGAWVMVCLAQGRPGFAAALRGNLDQAVRPE